MKEPRRFLFCYNRHHVIWMGCRATSSICKPDLINWRWKPRLLTADRRSGTGLIGTVAWPANSASTGGQIPIDSIFARPQRPSGKAAHDGDPVIKRAGTAECGVEECRDEAVLLLVLQPELQRDLIVESRSFRRRQLVVVCQSS